jgi:predicted anti-sigma-YlaC factor YlaD
MTAERCPREDELLDALGRSFVGPELTEHVAACAACTELRTVAGALLDDRAAAMIEAPVPAAGTVWWRMQLRHRREAHAVARRSLLIGQAVTLAIAAILIVSLFGGDIASGVREAVGSIRLSTPILLALASSLLAAPVVGWAVVRGK